MNEHQEIPKGKIISADLTISNAEEIRDFYRSVVGWDFDEIEMDDNGEKYADYVAKDKSGNWVGGVCHKKGQNSDLSGMWIPYINVENIEKSISECEKLGGKVLKKSQQEDGTINFVLLQDPTGAVFGIVSF